MSPLFRFGPLLFIALLCLNAAAETGVRLRPAAPRQHSPKTVSLEFANADLVFVLKVLAKEMNRNIYVGPTVQGNVTMTVKDAPVESVLQRVVSESGYELKLLDGGPRPVLIVAATTELREIEEELVREYPRRTPPGEFVKALFWLEEAPSTRAVAFLRGQYDKVEITVHPTMNAVYAQGSREHLLQIMREFST